MDGVIVTIDDALAELKDLVPFNTGSPPRSGRAAPLTMDSISTEFELHNVVGQLKGRMSVMLIDTRPNSPPLPLYQADPDISIMLGGVRDKWDKGTRMRVIEYFVEFIANESEVV